MVMKAWVMRSTAWSCFSPTARLHCVRQHLYSNPETLLIPNSLELSHIEPMLSLNIVSLWGFFVFLGGFFARFLLPDSWPPLGKSSITTRGVSDQQTKIISHPPDPWQDGVPAITATGACSGGEGIFIHDSQPCMGESPWFNQSLLLIFMCPMHKLRQFSPLRPPSPNCGWSTWAIYPQNKSAGAVLSHWSKSPTYQERSSFIKSHQWHV